MPIIQIYFATVSLTSPNSPLCMYLNNKCFVSKSRGQTQFAHVGGFIDEVLNAMEDSTTSGRYTTVDAALADGLTGNTGMSIDILIKKNDTEEL